MNLRQISDDFLAIGDLAILQKHLGNDSYDFAFRNHFDCKSIVSEVKQPVLLHVGAIEDYAGIEEMLAQIGMRLLVSEKEHLRCSTIEKWYPAIKDKTPFTKIYDELPDVNTLLEDFSFPVFIKGNRQTNRHKKSQCIIESTEAYEQLRREWKNDSVLHWQKAAIREFIPLQIVDDSSFPDMVPISYEFRFFYFDSKCMGYGPYWTIGPKYEITPEDLKEALKLADWASSRVSTLFLTIDIAKTASGEWIVIEVNDAQESGFAGANPFIIWSSIIKRAHELAEIDCLLPMEEFFPKDTVIMAGDPAQGITIEDMRSQAASAHTDQEIADAFAIAENMAWWVEDDMYDYELGTPEYERTHRITDDWLAVADSLRDSIITILRNESMDIPEKGQRSVLSLFMERNGYHDGNGWWVKK